MFVAAQRLTLGDGSTREIGDPVPEAAKWPNLRAYLDQHRVLLVSEGLTLDELDTLTQVRVRRLGIADKLVGLGILRQTGAGADMPVAHVGAEISGGSRITTHEIDTATAEPAESEPEPEKQKRKKHGRR